MNRRPLAIGVWLVAAIGLVPGALAAPEPAVVWESPRAIPVAYRVDVVVVGGGTDAVAAAVAAARAGAKVFLAAPRPYLGDDVAGTLRLWVDAGAEWDPPLARRLLDDESWPAVPSSDRMAMTYEADLPTAGRHRDTVPPSKLADGVGGNPATDSVEYRGDVNLRIDLHESRAVRGIRLMAHHRDDHRPAVAYKIERVTVLAGNDGRTWREVAEARPTQTERSYVMSIPLTARARYLKLSIAKCPDAERILISEVEVLEERSPDEESTTTVRMLRPMHVKKVLDDALLEAGVSFLFGCFPTDVVRDGSGRPCGIVMANRAGRQAVLAATVVDATDRATVARLAGARCRQPPGPTREFRRVVIGGEIRRDPGVVHRVVGSIASGPRSEGASPGPAYPVVEYALSFDLPDASYPALAEAEQNARDLTYGPGQVRGAEKLFFVAPDAIVGRGASGPWDGFGAPVLDAFRPEGVDAVYVLGPCADVARGAAETLLEPARRIKLGEFVGEAAAREALSLGEPEDPHLPGRPHSGEASGDVKEVLVGVRPTQKLAAIPAAGRSIPVLGRYDVVVIGGGTSGAAAGIGAARRGARTLVVEYQEGLGGIGTVGLIGRYHAGNRVGFTAEVPPAGGEPKMEWWRSELRRAGADVWLGALGCGALVDGSRVTGVAVANPDGRGAVLADVVIDATGNADVAAAAGADVMTTDEHDVAVQGAGMPDRAPGAVYTNTDYLLVDDADMVDVWRTLVSAKRRYAASFDLGTIVQTRERRRVVGDFVLSYLDQMAGRTYPDSIVQSTSNYDSHGYPSHPFFAVVRPASGKRPDGGTVYTPYRCLLPRGLEGMLVVGLGTSAHRDALALIRMQPDLQNQGYAAGVAAAIAVEDGVAPRAIDVKKLQRHLVDVGNLPENVLTDDDSFPASEEALAAAVENLRTAATQSRDVALVFAHAERAVPLVRAAYERAAGEEKVTCAILLGACGDATGAETLLAELHEAGAWEERKPLGVMAEYSELPTRTDALILALGCCRAPGALSAIVAKAETLGPDVCLSHHRAVALALECYGAPEAAEALSRLLRRPGMSGYAQETLAMPGSRIEPLREIVLARALYRCGDHEAVGETILRRYTRDLRGHLARHATAVLGGPGNPD